MQDSSPPLQTAWKYPPDLAVIKSTALVDQPLNEQLEAENVAVLVYHHMIDLALGL